MRLIIFIVLVTISSSALACSFGHGYELFEFAVPDPKGIEPETPVLLNYSLKRGYDDGNGASCSDAGVLELNFSRTHGVGYLIEPMTDFESNVFPLEVIQPTGRDRSIRFVWLDWPRRSKAPFDLRLRVTAFYANGRSSKPIEIRIIPVSSKETVSITATPNLVLQWDGLSWASVCCRKPTPSSTAPEHRC